jgi:hypothetical protein
MGNGRKSKGHKHTKGKSKKPKPAPAEEEPASTPDFNLITHPKVYGKEFVEFVKKVGINTADPDDFAFALDLFGNKGSREKLLLAAADAEKNSLEAATMREAKDDGITNVELERQPTTLTMVFRKTLEILARDAWLRKFDAHTLTRLKAHCDAVGEQYPDHVLEHCAAPASSRPTAARRRRRESVERPGRAVRRSASSARPRGRRTTASHAGEARSIFVKDALSMFKLVFEHAPDINALPVVKVGAPAPRDDRFGARSNSLAIPWNRADRARPRRPPKCPQVLIAPLWRAFAAFLQFDVGNFAYFVERADPFEVRFTLPFVMCAYVTDGGFIDFEFELEFDRETFTKIFGRTVTCEAIRLFRQHSPYFADGVDKPILIIAHLMVDGSAERLKFLMMGAHGGCGVCARLAREHLERVDPVREDPRPFF